MLEAFSFKCGYNGCVTPLIPTLAVLAAGFILFCASWTVLRHSFKGSLAILLAASVVFIITLFPQTFFRWAELMDRAVWGSPLSAHEKRARMFGDAYLFAERSKGLLPGNHSARLVTDINVHEGDGCGIYDRLAYYLYPVDIRYPVNPGREDAILFFHKKNAATLVPSGYRMTVQFNDQDMIAVRTGAF